MDVQTKVTRERVCEKCGSFDAVEIGNRYLCVDCYEVCGSCCPEFGGDDLWDLGEAKHPQPQAGVPGR